MLLVFLDTETTGLNPDRHRIVEIAFKIIDSVTKKNIVSYSSIVQQTPEVWAEADKSSLQINGFTWEMLLSGKPEKVVSSEIINDLNRANIAERGGVFICQNPSFDRAFFCQLVNVDLQAQFSWPYHWLDLASMFWAMRHFNGSSNFPILHERELSKDQIATYFGIPPEEKPHRAMQGVSHLIACFEALFKTRVA